MKNFSRGQICEIFKIKHHKLYRIENSGALKLNLEKNHSINYNFEQLVHLYFFNLLNEFEGFSTAVNILKSMRDMDLAHNPDKKFIIFSDRAVFISEIPSLLDELMHLEILAYFTWDELRQATIKVLERSYQTVQAS